ncbi:MAG: nuclear transport factor 2 family protein [Paracoccaceae bacterium]|nr:MAG: nuclear transport factor 2 family protein [Paracoccaceae bacterium]
MPPIRSAAIALLCLGPGAAGAELALDAPRRAAEVFVAAVNARDAKAIAAIYAPDAVVLNPASPPIAGRDAIGQAWAQNLAGGLSAIAFGDIRTERGSDRAAVMWTWEITVSPPGQAAVVVRGRSLVYFVLTPQGWQISADMWHPAP